MTGEQHPLEQATPSAAQHQVQLLGQALGECLVASGIIRSDVSLSGPELLMFAEDLKRHLSAPGSALSEEEERLAFEAKFPVPVGVSFHPDLKRYCVGARGTLGEMDLYQSAWECWKASAARPAPVQQAERGDAFNVQDPELNNLLNLAVDIHVDGGNQDSAQYMMDLLERVEARLAAQAALDEQTPVAYRILRKTHAGLWSTDGRTWVDGLPSDDVKSSVASQPDLYRLMYAYTSPFRRPALQPIEITWPEYHHEGMGCGLEDRGITDRYEACQYGFEQAIEQMAHMLPDVMYAEQPEPGDLFDRQGKRYESLAGQDAVPSAEPGATHV